jgi:hypothetical protein
VQNYSAFINECCAPRRSAIFFCSKQRVDQVLFSLQGQNSPMPFVMGIHGCWVGSGISRITIRGFHRLLKSLSHYQSVSRISLPVNRLAESSQPEPEPSRFRNRSKGDPRRSLSNSFWGLPVRRLDLRKELSRRRFRQAIGGRRASRVNIRPIRLILPGCRGK